MKARWDCARYGACWGVLGVFALGCSGDDGPTSPAPVGPVVVATITITPASSTLNIGDTQQLTATLRDVAGNVLFGRPVSWTSSDNAVATIDATGLVRSIALGQVTITATSEGKVGSATVSVAALPANLRFVLVVAGGAHTCALTTSGSAYCWGRGERGQLGVPAPTTRCETDGGPFPCSMVPVPVDGGFTFTHLAGGGAHTCGLTSDGSAYCWGSNTSGQLGDNSFTSRNGPVPVATGLKFASMDAGTVHTCGLTSDGTAYCWGANDLGQLGDGRTTASPAPVAVSGGFSFQQVTGGGFNVGHTCGLANSGAAFCWGDNTLGQLGSGASDEEEHPEPIPVSGGLAFAALTTGLGSHTCGLTSTGAAYCWGANAFGALGNGTTTDSAVPVPVSGGLAFVQLTAGGFIGHTCGFTGAGSAFCWGENERGQIGDGSTVDRLTPSPVTGGLAFTSMDAGFRHTCGIATTGTVYCWGSNGAGQLGNNSNSPSAIPVKVVGQS